MSKASVLARLLGLDSNFTAGDVPGLSAVATSGSASDLTTGSLAYARLPNSGFELGGRNRIINGDMRIDQRNAGASVTTSVLQQITYTVDRWAYYNDVVSKRTIQQSSIAPPGFSSSLLVTVVGTDTTGPQQFIRQSIEGLNVADLGWGSANAQPLVLSFWVRSSVTGQHGGTIQNNVPNRSYPFSYTINSANTWEYKTVTIPGDTSGTWQTNNAIGIAVMFEHGVGYLKSAAGAWVGANATSSTGSVNLCATNGATWYITGVQLEKGTVATPFEFRPYGAELALCQRYLPTILGNGTTNNFAGTGFYTNSSTSVLLTYNFPVQSRVPPTGLALGSTASFTVINPAVVNAFGVSSPAFQSAGNTFAIIGGTTTSGAANTPLNWLIYGGANNSNAYFTGCEL
jgi:hypothetical protein